MLLAVGGFGPHLHPHPTSSTKCRPVYLTLSCSTVLFCTRAFLVVGETVRLLHSFLMCQHFACPRLCPEDWLALPLRRYSLPRGLQPTNLTTPLFMRTYSIDYGTSTTRQCAATLAAQPLTHSYIVHTLPACCPRLVGQQSGSPSSYRQRLGRTAAMARPQQKTRTTTTMSTPPPPHTHTHTHLRLRPF